jgi:orotidine-5'-phosphate decarboxylase
MNKASLVAAIFKKKSYLCVGLDSDPKKIPSGMNLLDFNKAIIDATRDVAVAYKPNIAFYEVLGPKGWDILEKTVEYIGKDHLTIADAKRGDIGNTSTYYAQTFFDTYAFDAITVAPYMGRDSVEPFLQFENKWAIVLALTSNEGSLNFQKLKTPNGELFEEVLRQVSAWGNDGNTMFVVGATQGAAFAQVRAIVPHHFLLVPGVGAQGGSLADVAAYGMNNEVGLLVNASRSILYASSASDFATKARKEAQRIQQEMEETMKRF